MDENKRNTVLNTPAENNTVLGRVTSLFSRKKEGREDCAPCVLDNGEKPTITTKDNGRETTEPSPKKRHTVVTHHRNNDGDIVRTTTTRLQKEAKSDTRTNTNTHASKRDIKIDWIGGEQRRIDRTERYTHTEHNENHIHINTDVYGTGDRMVKVFGAIAEPLADGIGKAIGEIPPTIRVALSIVDKAITPFASLNVDNLIKLNNQLINNPIALSLGWLFWLGGIAAGIWILVETIKHLINN
jgi:hypothetical protein